MKKLVLYLLTAFTISGFSFTFSISANAAGNCEHLSSDPYGCHTYLCPNGCTLIICPSPVDPNDQEVGENCPD